MNEPVAACTIAIIIVTAVCSLVGFSDPGFRERFIFTPTEILACKQYYRLVTNALLHADVNHLFFNMISLYLFGRAIEMFYGPLPFMAIYIAAIIGGNLLALWLHRHHEYRALGASGGVCGVIFSYVFLFPGSGVQFFFIPVTIPGWLYAVGYLLYSFFALKRGTDNIGHDAHIGGSLIGLLTTTAMYPRVVFESPKMFVAVVIVSLLLFFYFLKNPMMLPLSSFPVRARWPQWGRRKPRVAGAPEYRREPVEIDAVLEKISRSGIESLTPREKELLSSVSAKYRRRGESQKPDSDLII